MVNHKHISYFQPGMLAMVGMPFMLLIFLNFKATNQKKCFEIYSPNPEWNNQVNTIYSEYDTIDYKHPRGHFYEFSFNQLGYYLPLDKIKLYYLFKNKPQQYDGFHIDLKNIKQFNDYVFLYNQMMIHGFYTYFEFNDQLYCYYNEKRDSLYRKKSFKQIISKELPPIDIIPYQCGHKFYYKELTFQEQLKNLIQPHITYWYLWLIYFITVVFSLKKFKIRKNSFSR